MMRAAARGKAPPAAVVRGMGLSLATVQRFCYIAAIIYRHVKAISLQGCKVTPAQCRMARAALQLGIRELAEAANVSSNTIVRFERGEELLVRTIGVIQRALEAAGIVFIEENGGGAGVRLKNRAAEKR